jgi:hypothetical protein
MLNEIEQQTLDIDWFFTTEQHVAFVASGGGKLPKSVANSAKNIKLLTSFFRNLPRISEAIINPNLNKINKTSLIDNRYLEDFVDMAEKGLFTYDKTILNDFSNSGHHLITMPANPLKFDQLPIEIRDILIETKHIGSIDEYIDSSLF